MDDIQIRRLRLAGHIIRMEGERIPRKFLVGNFIIQERWENQEKLGRRRQDGHITGPIEYEDGGGGQGPEGAVEPQTCGRFNN